MKKLLALPLLAMVFANPAPAATIFGGGNAKCSALIDADAFHTNSGNMQWFIGYVTGVSVVNDSIARQSGGTGRIDYNLREHDETSLVQMASNECRGNPNLYLYQVAEIWVTRLAKQ